jgi:DNA-binding NarL/FixJ family response regulator
VSAEEETESVVVSDEWRDRADMLIRQTSLKRREAEVRALKDEGLNHKEIAEVLGLSKSTVDEYSLRINDRIRRAKATIDLLDE